MSETPSSQSPFLGGGPKFNQAGNNAPMPGEKKAETPPPPPFGGPKVWTGVAVLIVLMVVLFFIYGNGIWGTQNTGTRPGISPRDNKPNLNPDATQ
jgi:hypothetical protein